MEYTNGHERSGFGDLKVVKKQNNSTTDSHVEQYSRSEVREESSMEISHAHTFTSDQQVTVLRQTVLSTRARLIGDLSQVDDHYIDSITIESFLEYIEDERLCNMPQHGSSWDKVLKWAEFFALQVSGYENTVRTFVPDSSVAAKLIWATCRVLIEVSFSSQSFSPM